MADQADEDQFTIQLTDVNAELENRIGKLTGRNVQLELVVKKQQELIEDLQATIIEQQKVKKKEE